MFQDKTMGSGDPGVDGKQRGGVPVHTSGKAVCISLLAGEWGQHGPPERSFYTGHEVRAVL